MKGKFVKTVTAILAATMVFGMTAFAAPKTMSDGGIFDAEYYAQHNADVVAAFGTDENALYQHYLTYGKSEGRLPYDSSAAAGTAAAVQTASPVVRRYGNGFTTDTSAKLARAMDIALKNKVITLTHNTDGTITMTDSKDASFVDIYVANSQLGENVYMNAATTIGQPNHRALLYSDSVIMVCQFSTLGTLTMTEVFTSLD